jgi:hypothetical protein
MPKTNKAPRAVKDRKDRGPKLHPKSKSTRYKRGDEDLFAALPLKTAKKKTASRKKTGSKKKTVRKKTGKK